MLILTWFKRTLKINCAVLCSYVLSIDCSRFLHALLSEYSASMTSESAVVSCCLVPPYYHDSGCLQRWLQMTFSSFSFQVVVTIAVAVAVAFFKYSPKSLIRSACISGLPSELTLNSCFFFCFDGFIVGRFYLEAFFGALRSVRPMPNFGTYNRIVVAFSRWTTSSNQPL